MDDSSRGGTLVTAAPAKAPWAVVGLWLVAALSLGATGVLARTPMPVFPLVLWVLVALEIAALWLAPGFRRWVLTADVTLFVAFHLTRFVGFRFLVLYEQGRLPYDFAVKGGWGDIVVALGAVALLATARWRGRLWWGALLAWNVVGLIDILFVVVVAARSAFAEPAGMAPLTVLPLSLLPTFVVPIILFTHGVIFARVRSGMAAAAATA